MNEWIAVLFFASPLILAAIGDCLAQRSGVLNIGLEGQMLLAAYVGIAASRATGNVAIGLLAGCLAGVAFAVLAGWFAISLAADQVVVGTAVNLLALGITGTLYHSNFSRTGVAALSPTLPKFYGMDLVMVSALFLAFAAYFVLFRTRWGLRLRAGGENPEAAASTGVSVNRMRYAALAMAGALGGLGGGYLSIGVAGSFSENMTQGRGFVAIAMVTFGRWKPQWILASCILIGWLESIQFTAQAKGWNVPFQLFLAAPYIVAILVLVAAGKGAVAPAALGLPFRSQK